MRLFQRFNRLPSDEPQERDIQLSAYPSQTMTDIRCDDKNFSSADYEKVPIDTEYNAGSHQATQDTNPQPRRLVDRIEDVEHRRFSTRIFGAFHDVFLGGWRAGLLRSFILSSIAFILNISIYAWLYSTYNTHNGSAVVRTGSCSSIRWANTGIHAALNVLSTLILGASTYAMQGTTAPSRKEVDRAHAKGKWVEIGTQSVRNLPHVRKRNTWIWLLLGVTSLPFHLFFNAVFFTTTRGNQYAVAVVDKSILSNSNFEPTDQNASPNLFPQFSYSRKDCGGVCNFSTESTTQVFGMLRDITNSSNSANLQGFAQMAPHECIQTYATGYLRNFGDIAVVTKRDDTTKSPVIFTRYPQRSILLGTDKTNTYPFHWMCKDIVSGEEETCSEKLIMSRTQNAQNWTVNGQPVDHCLARIIPDTCDLQFNGYLMIGVLVFGFIKTLVMLFLLFSHPAEQFLHTLGDAIACYLQTEDPTTTNMCLISSKQIRKQGFKPPFEPQTYMGHRPPWFSAANSWEFGSTIGCSALYIIVLTISLIFGIKGAAGTAIAFSSALGAPDYQSLAYVKVDDTGSSGIVPTLIIANIPQLGFSFLYVVYTNIWAKLLIAREFDNLTRQRKGLRVSSRPRGMQRTGYFFSLPARYALPLMACSATLHWLCSQSFFMVRIDGTDAAGAIDPLDRLVRLGYNSKGVVLLISMSVAMLVGTVAVGYLRKLSMDLGEASMSVVISAACHAATGEDEAWLKEVQWGDVTQEMGGSGVRHVCFTSGSVRAPVVGAMYA